jgi:hypothetical protein
MNRRDFLRHGALATAAVGAGGCATFNLQPPSDLFSVRGMKDFIDNLDGAMKQTFTRPIPRVDEGGPRDEDAELLARQGLGALLLSGSLGDLSPEDQVHPGMQRRIRANAPLIDRAVLGMNARLQNLTPTERSDVARELTDDPDLGMKVIGMLDGEASAAGVPAARRLKLRTIGMQACSRLRQSPSLVIDEYGAKVEKAAARQGDLEFFERQLAARMGHDAFLAHKEKLISASGRWNSLLAAEGEELTPPPPPPPVENRPPPPEAEDPTQWSNDEAARRRKENADQKWPEGSSEYTTEERENYRRSGNILLGVGGGLMGLGAVAAGIGIILFVSGAGGGWGVSAVLFTAAGLLVIGGLVCLIVGGVRRGRAG